MFDQTFIKPASPASKAGPLTVSLIFQCAAVVLVVVLSIARTQTLPIFELSARLIAPPPPVQMHPQPQKTASGSAAHSTGVLIRPTPAYILTPRPASHNMASSPQISTDAAPEINVSPFSVDPANGVISSLNAGGRPVPPRESQPQPRVNAVPQHVSEGVAAANLIQKVIPKYPRLAVTARVQGSVRFRATIGTDGGIQNLQLLAGPPLLVAAAREAVLAWRYRPTLLNGVPVPVLTDITVNFTLGSNE